jgi:hypothetical protein
LRIWFGALLSHWLSLSPFSSCCQLSLLPYGHSLPLASQQIHCGVTSQHPWQ